MKGSGWDEALVKSLIEIIDFELRAQLATANLDPAEIQGIATMVADQVLAEFEVSPRAKQPAPD
jgi:hypothetical protein